jgi:hypothetical protein
MWLNMYSIVVYFADAIVLFFNRYRLVLPDYDRCLMRSKNVAGISSSNSTTSQVTGAGNNHLEAFVNDKLDPFYSVDADAVDDDAFELSESYVNVDRLEPVQAVDTDAVDDDAFEPTEELSDDESDDGKGEDLTTKSSSSKNRGQPGRRAKTKRVALTLAHKIAIIKH